MSKKQYIVRLTIEERAELEALTRRGRAAARKRTRAHVLLKTDQGEHGSAWTDAHVADAFGIHANTVKSIRQRFVDEGLESALNRKKQKNPSRPRSLDGKAEAHLIALACGAPPEGRSAWTLRLLADRVVELEICEGPVSHSTIWRTLKKTN